MGERATVHVDYKASGLQTLSQAGNLITGINQGLQLMRTGFTALTAVTKTFIATGSQFERYEVQFTTLLGSIEAARDRMRELTTFAMETPFDLPGVVEAAQKLEAYGVYAEKTLRTVGDAAAAMGKTLEQGVEAIADASRGELERLKEFGISAAELTKHLGKDLNRSTVEGLKEIQDAVLAIMGERYGGGMMALSKTLGGTISNLRGYWIEFKKEVADSEAFETVKDIFGTILDTVQQLFDQGTAERAATIIGETISKLLLAATVTMAQVALNLYDIGKTIATWLQQYSLEERLKGSAVGAVVAGGAGALIGGAGGAKLGIAAGAAVGGVYGSPISRALDWSARQAEWMWQRWQGTMAIGVPGGVPGGVQRSIDEIEALHREGIFGLDRPPEIIAPQPEDPIRKGLVALLEAAMGLQAGGGRPRARGAAGAAAPFLTYGPAMEEMGAGYFFTGEYGPQAGQAGPSDAAFARMEKQQKMIGVLTQSWESHYARISQAAFKWGQGEGRIIKDIYRMTKMSLVASLQDVVHYLTKKAAMKQLEQAAEALGSAAGMNFWGAAKHIAAAAAWGTLGGIAGGVIGGWAEEKGPDFGTVGEGAAGAPPDSRTISRGVGIKAQNITINIHVGHYGATVYGDGGIRQLWEEHLEPLIEQSFAMGRI